LKKTGLARSTELDGARESERERERERERETDRQREREREKKREGEAGGGEKTSDEVNLLRNARVFVRVRVYLAYRYLVSRFRAKNGDYPRDISRP
jgi:hypothetical protein